MVLTMMHQQTSSAQPPPPQTQTLRSPTPSQQLPSPPLPLPPVGPTPLRQAFPIAADAVPSFASAAAGTLLARVRLADIAPYEGSPCGSYSRAVEALAGSLTRYNAAVIELAAEDSAIMRCGLEAVRLFFRSRAQTLAGKGSRGVYMYRAGR